MVSENIVHRVFSGVKIPMRESEALVFDKMTRKEKRIILNTYKKHLKK